LHKPDEIGCADCDFTATNGTLILGGDMDGYTEEDIKNIITDMFEKAIPNKTRIMEIFKQVEDRYI
jgi:hypothetical protein